MNTQQTSETVFTFTLIPLFIPDFKLLSCEVDIFYV